jgi:hypothetical protein
MSDTPETDDQPIYALNELGYQVLCVDLEFARKLERERDEARHKLELCMAANSDVARIAKERDEARKHLRDANRGAEINAHINQKFGQQIIDAREQIKELIYIAERAIALAEIDFENDKFGVVSELRDGVERIKEGAK